MIDGPQSKEDIDFLWDCSTGKIKVKLQSYPAAKARWKILGCWGAAM